MIGWFVQCAKLKFAGQLNKVVGDLVDEATLQVDVSVL